MIQKEIINNSMYSKDINYCIDDLQLYKNNRMK